jgi:hypothetical protein
LKNAGWSKPGKLNRVDICQEAGGHEYPLLSFDLARRRIGRCVDCRPMVALTLNLAILIDCHFQRSAGKIATGTSNRAHILDRSG